MRVELFFSYLIVLDRVFFLLLGEIDQLGLGDNQRERKKPTLLKAGQYFSCSAFRGRLHRSR